VYGLGGIILLVYYAAVGVLAAGAGLIDLVLLPFRPLMPTTYYVGTSAVEAARVEAAAPLHAGHYVIGPPAPGDWRRISPRAGSEQSPTMDAAGAPYRGARELFVRDPTARRPSAIRKLGESPLPGLSDSSSPNLPRGRTEPAALLRVDMLEPGTSDLETRLDAFIAATRAGADPAAPLRASAGLYQEARHEQSFVQVGGMSCLRDELVYLWLDAPANRKHVSRRVVLTLACADPSCPGQVVSLVVRGEDDGKGELVRQGRTFLESLRVDPAVTPACQAR